MKIINFLKITTFFAVQVLAIDAWALLPAVGSSKILEVPSVLISQPDISSTIPKIPDAILGEKPQDTQKNPPQDPQSVGKPDQPKGSDLEEKVARSIAKVYINEIQNWSIQKDIRTQGENIIRALKNRSKNAKKSGPKSLPKNRSGSVNTSVQSSLHGFGHVRRPVGSKVTTGSQVSTDSNAYENSSSQSSFSDKGSNGAESLKQFARKIYAIDEDYQNINAIDEDSQKINVIDQDKKWETSSNPGPNVKHLHL
jgi:hypothetical protein